MKKYENTTIETSLLLELNNNDIMGLLVKKHPDLFNNIRETTAWVDVPTGGDYSGCALVVGVDVKLKVKLLRKKEIKNEIPTN